MRYLFFIVLICAAGMLCMDNETQAEFESASYEFEDMQSEPQMKTVSFASSSCANGVCKPLRRSVAGVATKVRGFRLFRRRNR